MADIEATDPDDYVVVDADGAVKGEVDGKKSAAEESGPNGDSNAADNADAADALAAAVDKSMTLTDGTASGDATAPPPPSAPRPSNDNVGADMCVRSLAWETTDQALREYFERFGEVTTCTVKTGPDGRSRGFGFVNFADKSAIAAVLEEEHVVDGKLKTLLVHRKGSTRAFPPHHPLIPVDYQYTGQPVLIGGTMGTCSYILTGTEKGMEETFGSTCHGAGRARSRNNSRNKLDYAEVLEKLKTKGIAIRVASPKLVMEEAPESYKDVTEVVNTCHDAGISKKAVKLRPIAVVKG